MPGCRCAVFGCNNSLVETKRAKKNTMFHRFPSGKNPVAATISAEWTRRCKRADNFNPNTSTICSDHFKATDYERDLRNELLGLPLRKILKKTAVPTLNLSGSKTETAENSRHQRTARRKRKQIVTDVSASERQSQLSFPQTSDSQLYTLSSSDTLPFDQKYQELLNKFNKLHKTFREFKESNRKEVNRLIGLLSYYKKKVTSGVREPKKKIEISGNIFKPKKKKLKKNC